VGRYDICKIILMLYNKIKSWFCGIVDMKEGKVMSKCNCHDDLSTEVRILVRLVHLLFVRQGELMVDFTKLNTSIDKLDADVRAHEAAEDAGIQASIDAAQVKVDATDTFVVGTGTGTST
jgi:hypothetical protein